jgi:hypothetical protein
MQIFVDSGHPAAAVRKRLAGRTVTVLLARVVLVASLVSWYALPAYAGVGIDIQVAPPTAPLVVEAPPPRAGFVWAPGFWRWEGHRHVWVGGHWLRERRGYRWAPDRWTEHGGHYHYDRGHWER